MMGGLAAAAGDYPRAAVRLLHGGQPRLRDRQTYSGSFRSVRNAFPLVTVGGVSDHQRALTRDKRVIILTRSGFLGQQRYGSNVWTGDVGS